MPDRFSISVPDETSSLALLTTLEGVLPVNFGFSDPHQTKVAGELLTDHVAGSESGSGASSVSSLMVPRAGIPSQQRGLIDFTVQFSDHRDVPFPFRGRSLRTKVLGEPILLSLRPDEEPLATCDRGPIWTSSNGQTAKRYRSGFALPTLPADGSLQDVLSGSRFLEILPFLQWLREICGQAFSVNPSPPKACFIFDDPNLHWPRYGYVDYRQLAEQAQAENYHVAFATIPLDTWFTHPGTAGIFRQHPERLSLLVHGNNHAKRELAQSYTESERIYLLKQAIRRIERLERRSGLTVSRVMVPPHGACSEEMLAALPGYGFEAACISHGSLRAHNKAASWTKTLGYRPSELVRSCPVLPRWGVSGDLKNTILLATYLQQAIILRGHHQDLKDGPEVLNELARFVNGLGSVEWMNMTEIVRARRQDGDAEAPRLAGANGSTVKSSGNQVRGVRGASLLFVRRLLTEGRDRIQSVR
jgi:hypothetical protein